MSDLRTRIAAVLKTANDRVAGFIGYDEMADAVIAVIREANDDIRPALRDALASWDDYDPYEAKADAERQQWADDEGIPR